MIKVFVFIVCKWYFRRHKMMHYGNINKKVFRDVSRQGRSDLQNMSKVLSEFVLVFLIVN